MPYKNKACTLLLFLATIYYVTAIVWYINLYKPDTEHRSTDCIEHIYFGSELTVSSSDAPQNKSWYWYFVVQFSHSFNTLKCCWFHLPTICKSIGNIPNCSKFRISNVMLLCRKEILYKWLHCAKTKEVVSLWIHRIHE